MNRRESKEIHTAALAAFLASSKQCIKELDTVPTCRVCGRIPRNYARFDDGTIQCAADSAINCDEPTSL
jgi:hypothetical protein